MNGVVTEGAWTFDDFDHGGGPITGLWGNYFVNYPVIQSVHYEIRSGIGRGDGGKLHAAGTLGHLKRLPTHRLYFGFMEWYVYGNADIAHLPAGRYYLAVQPRYSGPGRSFITTTSGKDVGPTMDPNPPPTGAPLRNGNSWFHSEHFGYNYVPASDPNVLGAGTWDFSYGVEIPEPRGSVLLGLVALSLFRR